jgi:hypothetical protein
MLYTNFQGKKRSLHLQAELEEPVDQPLSNFRVPIRRRVGGAGLSKSAVHPENEDGTAILTRQRYLQVQSSQWC